MNGSLRPVRDLRDALHRLDEAGRLSVVDRQVERSWEVTAVLDRLEREHRFPAVLFRSIKGFDGWSIAGLYNVKLVKA